MQTNLKFQRDLSRTTLAPPIQEARFTAAPDHRFLVRALRLHQDAAAGDYVIRLADLIGGNDTGDDAEARAPRELDARRIFRQLSCDLTSSHAWRRIQ